MIARRHKYGARVTELDGRRFPSQLEANVYAALRLLEKAGKIRELACQVRVHLCANVWHRVDFRYVDVGTGLPQLVEAKGMETETWALKRKLYAVFGTAPLDIYRAGRDGVQLTETIRPDVTKLGRDDLRLVPVEAPSRSTSLEDNE